MGSRKSYVWIASHVFCVSWVNSAASRVHVRPMSIVSSGVRKIRFVESCFRCDHAGTTFGSTACRIVCYQSIGLPVEGLSAKWR